MNAHRTRFSHDCATRAGLLLWLLLMAFLGPATAVPSASHAASFAGVYRLQKVLTAEGTYLYEAPLDIDYRATLDASTGEEATEKDCVASYRLQVKIANRFMVSLCLTEHPSNNGGDDSVPQQSYAVALGPVGGTKMMPLDEEVRALEAAFVDAFSQVTLASPLEPNQGMDGLRFSSADLTVQIILQSVTSDKETEHHA